jgi:hypothetical protein
VEDKTIGLVAAVVLAMIAFRRLRGVVSPEARRAATRRAVGSPSRRGLTAAFFGVRIVIGLAAVGGIAWLAVRLFP